MYTYGTWFIYRSYTKNVYVQLRFYPRGCNFKKASPFSLLYPKLMELRNCPFVCRANGHHLHNFTHWSWLTEAIIWLWGQSAKAETIPLCAVATVIGLLLLSVGFHKIIDCKKAQIVRFHEENCRCYQLLPVSDLFCPSRKMCIFVGQNNTFPSITSKSFLHQLKVLN